MGDNFPLERANMDYFDPKVERDDSVLSLLRAIAFQLADIAESLRELKRQ